MSNTGTFPDLQSLTDALGYTEPAVPSADVANQAPAELTFATQNLQPPTPLYVTVSDTMQLTVWNHVTGIEVDITGRVLRADGSIIRIFQPVFPTANRAANVVKVNLPNGWLLDISINTPTASVARGQCFAQCTIVRGAAAALSAVQLLAQDYVATGLAMQWPGGLVRSPLEGPGFIVSQTTTVGAGLDWSFTVPSNTRWKVRAVSAFLTASATVASRLVALNLKDTVGNIYYGMQCNASQTASQALRYNWYPGAPFTALITSVITSPIPTDTVLFTNMSISVTTANLQAGDQWSLITMAVEEWIEPQ